MKKLLIILGIILPCNLALAQDFDLNIGTTENADSLGMDLGGSDLELAPTVITEEADYEDEFSTTTSTTEEIDIDNAGTLDTSAGIEDEVVLFSLSAPSVSVDEMPTNVPTWTWVGSVIGEGFRYSLDSEDDWTETTEQSFTPDSLEVGKHTLYVQEKINGQWSNSGSASTIILLDVSGTDYVQNLPTATAHTSLLPTIIRLLITLGGLLAFVSFVYSGVILIIFADHEDDVTNAKRNLIYSIVGLAVIGFAYSVVAGILNLI